MRDGRNTKISSRQTFRVMFGRAKPLVQFRRLRVALKRFLYSQRFEMKD